MTTPTHLWGEHAHTGCASGAHQSRHRPTSPAQHTATSTCQHDLKRVVGAAPSAHWQYCAGTAHDHVQYHALVHCASCSTRKHRQGASPLNTVPMRHARGASQGNATAKTQSLHVATHYMYSHPTHTQGTPIRPHPTQHIHSGICTAASDLTM